jgi:hypothetical protein
MKKQIKTTLLLLILNFKAQFHFSLKTQMAKPLSWSELFLLEDEVIQT